MIQGPEAREDERRPASLTSLAGDAELRGFVERALGAEVAELERRPLVPTTSFPCEILRARLAGRDVQLFFKDYDRCRLPRADDAGPAREIGVYRSVLDPQALGTPTCLGARIGDGRTWLLLEHVRGAPLAKGDRPAWSAAAAWLAELQAQAVPADAEFLAVHDAAHLHATVQQAVQAVAEVDLALEHELQKALLDYEVFAERLAGEPRTLVHGSYRPENLLVREAAQPARLAPVDWEHAALGSALYDVAFLTAGLAREKAAALVDVFRAAAEQRGRRLPGGAEAWELVSILRLHKLLRSLGRARSWDYPRATVEHLVQLAGRTSQELRAALGARARARVPQPADAQAHPALSAWRTLGIASGADAACAPIERLQGRYFSRKGRVVYRLGALGPEGLPVVAKRCQPSTVALERFVYTELLPRLGLSAPRSLGWVADGRAGWLFLEDVGSERLDPGDAEQRALATRWLAELQLASTRIAGHASALPDRGARGYLQLLAEARRVIGVGRANPALTDEQRARLHEVHATCERIETGWERITAACARMPATFVHGDFRPKNLFVQRHGGELRLRPIDWEYSGWGVPAADLGSLLRDHGAPSELADYRHALAALAPGLDEARAWEWVRVGRVLRAVASIHWTRNSLAYPFVEKPVRNLCEYVAALSQAFDELREPAPGEAGR